MLPSISLRALANFYHFGDINDMVLEIRCKGTTKIATYKIVDCELFASYLRLLFCRLFIVYFASYLLQMLYRRP